MADGYDVDLGALVGVSEELGQAEADLGAAAGPGVGADAGASTAILLQVAGLQAEGMAAVGQALGQSAADLGSTATAYAQAEGVTVDQLISGG